MADATSSPAQKVRQVATTLSPRRRLEVEVIAADHIKNVQPLNSTMGNHQVGSWPLMRIRPSLTKSSVSHKDPYVVCMLIPGEQSREQTQVHLSGGTAPQWDESMDNRLQMKFSDSCTHLAVEVGFGRSLLASVMLFVPSGLELQSAHG